MKREQTRGARSFKKILQRAFFLLHNFAPLSSVSVMGPATRLSNYVNRFPLILSLEMTCFILLYLFIYFFWVEAVYYFKWHCSYNIDWLPWKKFFPNFSLTFFFFTLACARTSRRDKETTIKFDSNDIRWLVVLSPVTCFSPLFFFLCLFSLISFSRTFFHSLPPRTHARTHPLPIFFWYPSPSFQDIPVSFTPPIIIRSVPEDYTIKTLLPRETTRRSKILILRFASVSVCGSVHWFVFKLPV